jgi:hypothetical protein
MWHITTEQLGLLTEENLLIAEIRRSRRQLHQWPWEVAKTSWVEWCTGMTHREYAEGRTHMISVSERHPYLF